MAHPDQMSVVCEAEQTSPVLESAEMPRGLGRNRDAAAPEAKVR